MLNLKFNYIIDMDVEISKFLKDSANKNSAIKVLGKKKDKIIECIIIYILLFLVILLMIIINALYHWFDKYIFTSTNINNNQNNFFLDYYIDENDKMKSLIEGQNFFNLCIKGELIYNIPSIEEINENPLISVVIPVYNTGDKIKGVVRSAQNQNISNEETYNAIKVLQKEDKRIFHINNKKNRGTLYSRCIGTLKAKGKYIFPLDNDDLFFDENLFYIITNEAENGNFDIVEFRGASREIYDQPPKQFINTNYSNHQHGLILYQPELGQYARKRGNQYGVYDCFLWAKCIRSEIYKSTINYIGKRIYSHNIIWGEDLIISFVLFRVAKSFKFIGRYGIFRYLNTSTATYHTPEKMIAFSKIIYLYIILKFTENNYIDKQYASFRAIGFIKSFQNLNLGNKNFIYLRKIVKSILANEYIYISDKNKIESCFQKISSLYHKIL